MLPVIYTLLVRESAKDRAEREARQNSAKEPDAGWEPERKEDEESGPH